MKTFLAMALLLVAAAPTVSAADYLKVTEQDGKETTFALATKPVVTFTADALVLTTSETTVEYPATATTTFTFSDVPTAIKQLATQDARQALFALHDGMLSAEGLVPGSRLAIYDANGRQQAMAKVSDNGTAAVSVAAKGLYIVKSSNRTFKLIIK